MSFLLQKFTNFTAWFLWIEADLTLNKNVQSDIKYRKFNETSKSVLQWTTTVNGALNFLKHYNKKF
jgi:hypothetical protein